MKQKYGEDVVLGYVDLMKDDMTKYPDVQNIMGRFTPPLVVINGEPRFHGGLSVEMISEVVDEIREEKN